MIMLVTASRIPYDVRPEKDDGEMGVDCADLNDFATIDFAHMQPAYLTLGAFAQRLAETAQGGAALSPLTFGGAFNMRFVAPPKLATEEANQMVAGLRKYDHFSSPPQFLQLIDQPCYVLPATGAVILEDGRVIADTVYPSTGELDIQRVFGAKITSEALEEAKANAPEWDEDLPPILLFSRWSNVYFHAFTESLVHINAIKRKRLDRHCVAIAPETRSGSQRLVSDMIDRRRRDFAQLLVRVPRVVTSSLLYSHSVTGLDFQFAVEAMRADFFTRDLPLSVNPWKKVYVSRLGATARKMLNEAELISELRKLGFRNRRSRKNEF